MKQEKFIISVGLNDKETKTQIITTDEALNLVNKTVLNGFGGATIYLANGIYKHDNGQIVCENTIRIELLFSTLEDVRNLCKELKTIFNQESILLEHQVLNADFI